MTDPSESVAHRDEDGALPDWLTTALDRYKSDDLLTVTLSRADLANALGALQQESERVASRPNPNGNVTEVEQHGHLKSLLRSTYRLCDEMAKADDRWPDGDDWAEQSPALSRWRAEQEERSLHSALALMVEAFRKHDLWCGHNIDAPGDAVWHEAMAAAEAALSGRSE